MTWLTALLNSGVARKCGVPQATPLQRPHNEPAFFSGSVLLLGKDSECSHGVRRHLSSVAAHVISTEEASSGAALDAIVFDGTDLQHSTELDLVWSQLHSVLPRLVRNGRLLVLARAGAATKSADAAAAAAALSGFTRSIAKELGRFGSTANLLSLGAGAEQSLIPAVEYFLSKASAYVTGQVLEVKHAEAAQNADWQKPLAGQIALVTGAARGIGAAIATTLTAQGASVIGLDVPQAEAALNALMEQLQGESLLLDISQADSADYLAHWLKQRDLSLDVLVHNAGITRDKLFHRMSEMQWRQTLDINLRAVQRIDALLLEQQLLKSDGRVVLLSSMNGLAGQKGQTNYASSKAALVGYCQFMAAQAIRGIRFNAVAPGFIETQMTAAMPLFPREIGRRLNSLQQAGLPEDVALAVAFFARPDAKGLNGTVLRVCGQCLIGA